MENNKPKKGRKKVHQRNAKRPVYVNNSFTFCITLGDYIQTHLYISWPHSHSHPIHAKNTHPHAHSMRSGVPASRVHRMPLHSTRTHIRVLFNVHPYRNRWWCRTMPALQATLSTPYIFQWQILVGFSSVLFTAMSTSFLQTRTALAKSESPTENRIPVNFT